MLSGIRSRHSNHFEDRQFYLDICNLTSRVITTTTDPTSPTTTIKTTSTTITGKIYIFFEDMHHISHLLLPAEFWSKFQLKFFRNSNTSYFSDNVPTRKFVPFNSMGCILHSIKFSGFFLWTDGSGIMYLDQPARLTHI